MDEPLIHSDFYIGLEFWTEAGKWLCTDIGTRTICAISLEPHEIITRHEDGSTTSQMTDDPSWLIGPPYKIVEHVFDECDFGAMYINPVHRAD